MPEKQTSPYFASDIYFTEPLPWLAQTWQMLINQSQLSHALLFAGVKGLGKRHLVWQFVAYLLCQNRDSQRACGSCQSCLWLKANTHPNLKVLPAHHLPTLIDEVDKNKKSSAKINQDKPAKSSIKIDDIRALTPFLSQHSDAPRIVVVDDADTMTVAAANALLKSLEEPAPNVYFLLITDSPTKLLPTILSRVQRVALTIPTTPIIIQGHAKDNNIQATVNYIKSHLNQNVTDVQIQQALNLVQNAPLQVMELLQSDWYAKRDLWLKTWHALRTGKRTSTAASDYWQGEVDLHDFIELCHIMLGEVMRVRYEMPATTQDINWQAYSFIANIPIDRLSALQQTIADIQRSGQQNVQDKLGYDKLMQALAET